MAMLNNRMVYSIPPTHTLLIEQNTLKWTLIMGRLLIIEFRFPYKTVPTVNEIPAKLCKQTSRPGENLKQPRRLTEQPVTISDFCKYVGSASRIHISDLQQPLHWLLLEDRQSPLLKVHVFLQI